jgi:hypothetical protein
LQLNTASSSLRMLKGLFGVGLRGIGWNNSIIKLWRIKSGSIHLKPPPHEKNKRTRPKTAVLSLT